MRVDQPFSGLPTWFGPHEEPLFGVVHVPDNGLARAGVVLCPPLGKEHVDTYRGMKLLAQRLCARGLAVLRFDYAGTGDSALSQGAVDAVSGYQDSVRAAVEYLRDCGVPDVAVLGLRAGALLAGVTAPTIGGLAGVVLWDPATDGRRYLRQQQALYRLTVGGDAVGAETGIEPIAGLALSTVAATQFQTLRLPTNLGAGVPVLALVRPEHVDDRRLKALAAEHGAEIRTASNQAAFVEPSSFVVEIPVGALYAITSWLSDTLPTDLHRVRPTIRTEATVAVLPGGQHITERIEWLGPNQLFAIRTSTGQVDSGQPTLLVHSTAAEHRVGVGRIWVETAREMAANGVATLRYDRRGTGETGQASMAFARIHSAESKADVLDAMAGTGVRPDRLIMTGVCSGAWNAAYGALQRGARSVLMINTLTFALRNVEVGPDEVTGSAPGDLPAAGAAKRLPDRFKPLIRRWLPYRLWLMFGKLGWTQVPEVLLRALHRSGVGFELVMAPEDFTWFAKQRGIRGAKRLSRRGWIERITLAPSGDHALVQRDIQNFSRARLLEAATREFGLLPLAPARVASVDSMACRGSRL